MNLLRPLLAATCAAAALAAEAAPLSVTASGTWDASVPVSFFTAPGQTWSLRFVVDSDPTLVPVPDFSQIGLYTTPLFTDFEFRLGGVAIAQSATYTSFYNAGNGGGLDVYFNDQADPSSIVSALSFFGPQMYSGDELDPTILPGVYDTFGPPSGGFIVVVDGVRFDLGSEQIVIAAVPAPPSVLLAAAALALLGTSGRPRRRSEPVAAVAG